MQLSVTHRRGFQIENDVPYGTAGSVWASTVGSSLQRCLVSSTASVRSPCPSFPKRRHRPRLLCCKLRSVCVFVLAISNADAEQSCVSTRASPKDVVVRLSFVDAIQDVNGKGAGESTWCCPLGYSKPQTDRDGVTDGTDGSMDVAAIDFVLDFWIDGERWTSSRGSKN